MNRREIFYQLNMHRDKNHDSFVVQQSICGCCIIHITDRRDHTGEISQEFVLCENHDDEYQNLINESSKLESKACDIKYQTTLSYIPDNEMFNEEDYEKEQKEIKNEKKRSRMRNLEEKYKEWVAKYKKSKNTKGLLIIEQIYKKNKKKYKEEP